MEPGEVYSTSLDETHGKDATMADISSEDEERIDIRNFGQFIPNEIDQEKGQFLLKSGSMINKYDDGKFIYLYGSI